MGPTHFEPFNNADKKSLHATHFEKGANKFTLHRNIHVKLLFRGGKSK